MGKTAFLFPGQGSQEVGMGESFTSTPEVRSLYETANDVMGFDLNKLMFDGPEDLLSKTENAQPALFTDSNARYRILKEKGIQPDCLLGHSLGEFSALVPAGCLEFEQGIALVRKRGELMGRVTVGGTMVAVVGLGCSEVEDLIGRVDESVTIANYNSPMQLVLSGREGPLNRTCRSLEEQGARCIELDVSGPFHSQFMEGPENEFKEYIYGLDFKDPKIPVLCGVSGLFETDGEKIEDLLTRQMTHPVRWIDYVKEMRDFGVDLAIEVGPGSTLVDLTRKIVPGIECNTFDEVI